MEHWNWKTDRRQLSSEEQRPPLKRFLMIICILNFISSTSFFKMEINLTFSLFFRMSACEFDTSIRLSQKHENSSQWEIVRKECSFQEFFNCCLQRDFKPRRGDFHYADFQRNFRNFTSILEVKWNCSISDNCNSERKKWKRNKIFNRISFLHIFSLIWITLI